MLNTLLTYYLADDGTTNQIPHPVREAPVDLSNVVDKVLGLAAWAGTVAGVVGVLVTGAMMASSMKGGQGSSEHMGRLGMVLGGCILVSAAGPSVSFIFG
ncbi:hypothetical protein [Streptomyces sp. NPDC047061]|uniref:hypothetical protein n=1 Tax=Streptomyces sp. NPDC047061 TaxID=3154605 RepID=UPI0033F772AC